MKSKEQQLLEEAYELVQLNELFESPYPFSEKMRGLRGEEVYVFSPTGNPQEFPKYRVFFALNDYEGELDIRFDYQATAEAKPTMDLTGSGNASRVMATVMAITKQHLDKLLNILKDSNDFDLQYAKITFSAKLSEKGRVKFYDTLATLLLRFLNQKKETEHIYWFLKTDENPTNTNSAKGYTIAARPKRNQSPEEEKTTKPSLNKFLAPSS